MVSKLVQLQQFIFFQICDSTHASKAIYEILVVYSSSNLSPRFISLLISSLNVTFICQKFTIIIFKFKIIFLRDAIFIYFLLFISAIIFRSDFIFISFFHFIQQSLFTFLFIFISTFISLFIFI